MGQVSRGDMDLKEEEILGASVESHWYYRNKARMLDRMLPADFNRSVMDVGAGSGFFSRHLAKRGSIDRAQCVDIGYPENRDELEGGVPIAFRQSPEPCDAGAVLFMDVIEHVEDDAALLSAYREFVPPTAVSVITVPAFQFMWSGHDIYLGHYRRYTVSTLKETIIRAGYVPLSLHYYYGLVFPAALAVRLLSSDRMDVRSHLQVHGPVVNGILDLACRLELPLMKLNGLLGLSVCATCRPA